MLELSPKVAFIQETVSVFGWFIPFFGLPTFSLGTPSDLLRVYLRRGGVERELYIHPIPSTEIINLYIYQFTYLEQNLHKHAERI